MEKPVFRSYTRPNGHNEFKEFILSLPSKDRQKLLSKIILIENKGLLVASKLKLTKKIDINLFEIRSRVSNNIQRVLYFHASGDTFVITHGFTKKNTENPSITN